jgi:hypothetical protein
MRNQIFILASLLFCASVCLADGPFDTQVEVVQTVAITAKSARIEQLSDRVAIFVDGEDPGRQLGLQIKVKSNAKFIAVRAVVIGEGRPIAISKLPSGDYLLFGKPGNYQITVIESDPDKGLGFTDVESAIVGSTPVEPVDPVQPPPSGDFAKLTEIACEVAKKINDPDTASALSKAYKQAYEETASATTVEAAKATVTEKRRAVLNARKGESLSKDWNAWLVAIEPEISKHLGSVASYRAAVNAISKALEKN